MSQKTQCEEAGQGPRGPFVKRQLTIAMDMLRQRRASEALKVLTPLVEIDRNDGQVRHLMGIASHMNGDHANAIRHFTQVVRLDSANADAWTGLGIAQHDLHGNEEAIRSLQRACELQPGAASAWFNLARAMHAQKKDPSATRAVLGNVLERAPNHLSAHLLLAHTLVSMGLAQQAAASYRDALRLEPGNAKAWLGLADIKTVRFSSSERRQLENVWKQVPRTTEAYVFLGFALSKACEDQAQYAAAFEVLGHANAARRRQLEWNAEAERGSIRALQSRFAEGCRFDADSDRGKGVIFIVSLPRSGSTLVEQILASHSLIHGGGEICDLLDVIDDESRKRRKAFPDWAPEASAEDWARLGQAYLTRTASLRETQPYATDKNLLNWKLVGFARAMLPGARFVLLRRDPLETCLACYRQCFQRGNHFSYDLGDMVAYWRDYDRLTRYWIEQCPSHCMDLRYEDLLASPETVVRDLLDFCGVPYEERCLAFHQTERAVHTASAAQVRQPLQRDTARAHLYGAALDPLRKLLEDAS